MESTKEGHRASKRQCACKAESWVSMVEGKQAVIESTEEVEACARMAHSCDAVEEGKQEPVAADLETTLTMQEVEGATRKQCMCVITAEEDGTRNWADMAPDLLANILAYLPLDQLIMEIPFVCKAWKLASEYPLCWEKLDFSDPLLAVCGTPRLIERALRYCQGRLLEINVPCLRDRHCLDLLACSAPLLQKLYISESSANDEWATYAAPLLPNLKELDLSLCNVSFRALIAFGKNCRGITKLIWHRGFYFKLPVDDGDALAIAQHYPLLKHLELNANALSAEGLTAIVDNCPALTYLNLDECPNVVRRGTKKLLDLCRARFEFFGDPYDEYSLEDKEEDDDDDPYAYYDFGSSASENEYSVFDYDIDYVDYYTL